MQSHSAGEFATVYRFMTEGLGLRGSDLLVYARVFSFCQEESGTYFESAESCAAFLNMSERQVRRSLGNLVSRDLIAETADAETCPRGRTFVLRREAVSAAITRVEGGETTDKLSAGKAGSGQIVRDSGHPGHGRGQIVRPYIDRREE
jgi:predicted transcriptional regulator